MSAGRAPTPPDFGVLARDYDRLRPVDANWREVAGAIAEAGEVTGSRVLDVGCGTGRLAAALADRGARVWGVDPSDGMLAQARAVAGRKVGLKQGRAEELPFKDGWFDCAVLRLVVHLVDRPRAFAELRRVLAPGGRVVIATFAPGHFEWYWLVRVFPQVAEIDRRRFPSTAVLARELEEAGFAAVRERLLHQTATLARADALERIRGRFISTLRLLDEDAFAAGLAHAERELPEEVETQLEWSVVSARHAPR
ncbi:MAG TPA: methyltransferase domain-containing protein [Gaiellaceae bacterium]|nr:methyltransferase domain-containing protein [Gaiellaceae bacterium]